MRSPSSVDPIMDNIHAAKSCEEQNAAYDYGRSSIRDADQ
jgi:hypothetical protein